MNWIYRKLFPNHEHRWIIVKRYEWRNEKIRTRTIKYECDKCGEIMHEDIKCTIDMIMYEGFSHR